MAEVPAAADGPVLERGVAELDEQPSPLGGGAGQVRDPEFDVVEGAKGRAWLRGGSCKRVTGLACTSARSVIGKTLNPCGPAGSGGRLQLRGECVPGVGGRRVSRSPSGCSLSRIATAGPAVPTSTQVPPLLPL